MLNEASLQLFVAAFLDDIFTVAMVNKWLVNHLNSYDALDG